MHVIEVKNIIIAIFAFPIFGNLILSAIAKTGPLYKNYSLLPRIFMTALVLSSCAFAYLSFSGARLHVCGFIVNPVTSALSALTCLVGASVLRFSVRYLQADPKLPHFMSDLHLTLAAISTFMIADNIWLFVAAWVLISLTLHRLLLFYPERPGAKAAASKKFFLARASDMCLVGACVIWAFVLKIGAFSNLGDLATPAQDGAFNWSLASAFLIIAAAVLKSAQFPVHGWLVEVMETPTPVSALLHAGVVNAGGVLLIRAAPLFLHNPFPLMLLGCFALLSMIMGTLAIAAQTSVKARLAWSTVAQMGFMLLQCAIGAFAAALFHIIVHALYKAQAFLSAGEASPDLTEDARPEGSVWPSVALILAFGAAIAIFAPSPELALSGCALLAAISQMSARCPIASLAAGVFLVSLIGFNHLIWRIGISMPDLRPHNGVLDRLFSLGLVLLALVQRALSAPSLAPIQKALKVHARNGFYINAVLNRSLSL